MRIILGCPRSTQIEIMRLELQLPSITERIHELTATAVIRLIRRGEKCLKLALNKIAGNTTVPININCYLRKLCRVMMKYQLFEHFVILPKIITVKPWLTCRLNINIMKLDYKKKEWNSCELKQLFLSKINMVPRVNSIHIYCDGSVNGIKIGCGIVIREYFDNETSVDDLISKRIEDNSSITCAKLVAICEGLKFVISKKKDVYIFSDSQSALLSLNSGNTANIDIASYCKHIVIEINEMETLCHSFGYRHI